LFGETINIKRTLIETRKPSLQSLDLHQGIFIFTFGNTGFELIVSFFFFLQEESFINAEMTPPAYRSVLYKRISISTVAKLTGEESTVYIDL